MIMTLNEYQTLAARTIATDDKVDMERHALHGMVAEAGEILEAIKEGDDDHIIKELGDLFWMIAEFCTANSWFLEDIYNIHKYWPKDDGIWIGIGRLHGLFQKIYQGHRLDDAQLRDQTSRIIYSVVQVVEFNCRLEVCLERNIEKLKARYPDGFDPDRSLHRADGDV